MRSQEFITEDDGRHFTIGFNDEQAARVAIKVLGQNGIQFSNLGYDGRGVTSLRVGTSDETDVEWALDNNNIQYSVLSQMNETTTAGGIATVISAQGSTLTRNASIYGTDDTKKKKRKKSGKYKNSVNESAESNEDEIIKMPAVNIHITYDDRFGIRKWFMVAYLKIGSADSYVYTKDDKFTRQIPIEQVSFADYKGFNTVEEAKRALHGSPFYAAAKKDFRQ